MKKELLERTIEQLEDLQWRPEGDHCEVCPECHGCKYPHSDMGGHTISCDIGQLLYDLKIEYES